MEYPQSSTSGLMKHLQPRRSRTGGLQHAYFFIIMNRRALPKVWSSWSNWKDAAVSFAPGNFVVLTIGSSGKMG